MSECTDSERCLEIYNAVSDWEAEHGKQTCWEVDPNGVGCMLISVGLEKDLYK